MAKRSTARFKTKDEALEALEEARAEWLFRARAAARQIARSSGKVSIDDVREVCPIPDNVSGNVAGAVFKSKTDWRPITWVKSRQPDNHSRRIGVYEYIGASA